MDIVYLDSGVLVELLVGAESVRYSIKSSMIGRKRVTSVISFGNSCNHFLTLDGDFRQITEEQMSKK